MGNHDETERLDRAAILAGGGCRLRVIEGPDAGKEQNLNSGSAVVGSQHDADLRLTDTTVSGEHVRIEISADGIKVTDLGSTNGTFYLGTQIHTAVVTHGSVLTLGRTRLAINSQPQIPSETYSARTGYGGIVGRAPAMRRLYAVLERLEQLDYAILIEGETGVGKDLVAREVHKHSTRSNKPFEILDCGSVPSQLAESELFGHVRGAFTGAISAHEGVFSRGDSGAVFLDEIGELPLELQPKLLRVLEARELRPVGSTQTRTVDVRVIAATNRALSEQVRQGSFRQDLYFRLNVVTVRVPPLRERREDIPDLVRHFLKETNSEDMQLSADTLELFTCGYDWPGNVRELRNAIVRVLSLGTLPEALATNTGAVTPPIDQPVDIDEPFHLAKKRLVDLFERDYLSSQLTRSKGNLAKAARLSGMDRSYFKRLLKRHALLAPRGGTKDD